MLHSQLQQKKMLCECLSVWSEEFNGAECADLWHCGASAWQTEEMPEPACNELLWSGAIICPAACAVSLFRELNWSRGNGVCGPDYRMREFQCHSILYFYQQYGNVQSHLFLKSSLRSASLLSPPLILIVCLVFCFGFLIIFFFNRGIIFSLQ